MEVSFDIPNLVEVESMEPSWLDPQLLCTKKNSEVEGKVGPFGLLVLASENLTEQTAIFFRVFKDDTRHLVLMCTDLSRFVSSNTFFVTFGGKVSLRHPLNN